MKELIFISFAKTYSGKVAKEIKELLYKIYGNEKIEVFTSHDITAGNWNDIIHRKMKSTKYAISILTPENLKDAPWLMYEAGALISSVGNKRDSLMPFLFCRHISELDTPLRFLQATQYQLNFNANKEQMLKLLTAVNSALKNPKTPRELNLILSDNWNMLNQSLDCIAQDMFEKGDWRNGIATKDNTMILSEKMVTSHQSDISFQLSNFYPKTPREIEGYFENILNNNIPKEWKILDVQEKTKNSTRVLIGDTRISTFISFTDGKNILIFNRHTAEKDTKNVLNDKLDVFGSVSFENRSIVLKIANDEFLDSPIVSIKPIYGIAVEENRPIDKQGSETVIMIGINIFMDIKNLEKACKTNSGFIKIYEASVLATMKNDLTSKAYLATMSLIH